MKTLISSTGNKLDSGFDLRFGRAGWFCLLDEESGETSFHENENKDASHGAGQILPVNSGKLFVECSTHDAFCHSPWCTM